MPRSKATSTTFQLVGGKGGVGKTTCAAACAVAAAAAGQRTLIVSTDPAPSLGDAFGMRLSATPRRVPLRRGALDAVAVNAHLAFARWLRTRREVLELIAVRGSWLDEADVHSLFDLSLPGIDEVAALLELLRFRELGTYDLIVVDTAPTGHTLRMLAMPDTFAGVARVFRHMQAKHRAIVAALRGAALDDAADDLIRELEKDARELRRLLSNPAAASLWLITLPEQLAVEETFDTVRQLDEWRVPVTRVIANRLTPPPPDPCGWCDVRRDAEVRAVRQLLLELPRLMPSASADLSVCGVAAREREPVGVAALAAIAPELDRPLKLARERRKRLPGRVFARADQGQSLAALVGPAVKVLMFGGKGGVGKTTCAAAAAVQLAYDRPDRRILVASVDPAHSLGDALNVALGDTPRMISGTPANLEAREVDAVAAFERFRKEYSASIEAVFGGMTSPSISADYDRRLIQDLMELTPPGLDELVAILRLVETLEAADPAGRFDLVVLDTAPTGHVLRLLETPATIHEWTKALMAILLKYQSVTGLGELGASLVKLSRALGGFRALLVDPRRTQFVIVTRLAALPRAEAGRLRKTLARTGLSVAAVIANAVGSGECRRCRRTARADAKELRSLAREIARARPRAPLVTAPAAVPPPTGAGDLLAWRKRWRAVRA
jgi:arsenite-transporting ATPase